MFPIVDPHACLSGASTSVANYQSYLGDVHVLRMVMVLPTDSAENLESSLRRVQTLGDTRGSGGFPHAMLAPISELNHIDITRLLADGELNRLRGIQLSLGKLSNTSGSSGSSNCVPEWMRASVSNLPVEATVDLSVSVEQMPLAIELAKQRGDLAMVLSFTQLSADIELHGVQECIDKISSLLSLENVYLKLTALDSAPLELMTSTIDKVLHELVRTVGVDKIMFASGTVADKCGYSPEQLWNAFDMITRSLSASQRNKIFRLTASQVYKL